MLPKRQRTMGFLALALLLAPAMSKAQSPFNYLEEFDNDVDSYHPTQEGANDPYLDGLPPNGPNNVGSLSDWDDIRFGAGGLIEEIPSGYINDGFPGVIASSGATLALIGPNSGDGTFSRVGRTSSYPGPYSFQADVYTDPGISANDNGIPDFAWKNGVTNTGDDLTESGLTAEVIQQGSSKVWRFTTTASGNTHVDVPVGSWFTMEVLPEDNGSGMLQFRHKLWNQQHTQLLWSYLIDPAHVAFGPFTVAVGAPRYSWYTFFDDNMTRLFIDKAGTGWAIVPFVLGDMDGDLDVDNFDIEPFEMALTQQATYLSTYKLSDFKRRGDINGNGSFDNFDIEFFEDLLTSGTQAGMAAVPEPSTLLLLGFGGVGLTLAARRRKAS